MELVVGSVFGDMYESDVKNAIKQRSAAKYSIDEGPNLSDAMAEIKKLLRTYCADKVCSLRAEPKLCQQMSPVRLHLTCIPICNRGRGKKQRQRQAAIAKSRQGKAGQGNARQDKAKQGETGELEQA